MAPASTADLLLDSSVDAAAVAVALGAEAGHPVHVERAWYDTFDGDLWEAGLVLEVDVDVARRGPRHAVLRDRVTNAVRFEDDVEHVPALAGDLPAGPWRDCLADLLGIRALVPVATGRVAVTPIEMPGQHEHGLAALRHEVAHPEAGEPVARLRPVPTSGAHPVGLLELLSVGRPSPLPGARPAETHLLDDVRPHDADADHGAQDAVDPDDPAIDAVRAMLAAQRAVMRRNEPFLAEPPDPEFLHDFRVALRRSRSLLKQSRGVVAAEQLDRWRPILKALQQRTGPSRDLDVFVLELPQLRAALPEAFRDDLDPLVELLEHRRREAYLELAAHLVGEQHRAEVTAYDDWLSQLGADEPDSHGPDASLPVADAARRRIAAAHRKVRKAGRAITQHAPAPQVHELRIKVKELRYSIELLGSALPEESRKALLKRLKGLQDLLGAFQDAEVHMAEVRSFADELADAVVVPARTLMALGVLTEVFARRQRDLRAAFADTWAEFDSKKVRAIVDDLLAGAGA